MKDDLIRKLASGISDRHIKKYADFASEKDGIKVRGKTTPADNESASEGLKTPFLAAGEEHSGGRSKRRGGSGVREKRSGGFGTAWKVAASIAAVLVLMVAGILVGHYFRTRSDVVVTVPPLFSPEITALPATTQIDTDTPTPEVSPFVTEDPAPTAIVTPTLNDTPTATGTFTAAVTSNETPAPTSTLRPTATPAPTSTATPTAAVTPTASAEPTSTAAPTVSVEPTEVSTPTATPEITDAPATATPEQPTASPTLVPGDVPLDESNFPDSEFREYIRKNYDLNKDSVLSDGEIKLIDLLNVYYNHKSIKGIEHFYALEHLCFNGVSSKSLDLSLVPDISILSIGFASPDVAFTEVLEELDISKNLKLTQIQIRSNLITELDLSGNYELQHIDLQIPSLTKLDLSYNINLESFALKNMTLSELDLTHNSNLVGFDIRDCTIGNLILSENNSIKRLDLFNSGIEELDLKNNQVMTYLLYVGGDRLNISRCPNMRHAYLYGTYSSFYHAFDDIYTPAYEYPDEENAGTITLVTDCKNIYAG